MQNKKQTAVEWLYGMLQNEEVIMYHGLFEIWYKQAKAMEKEQIINAVEWDYKSNIGEVYYRATYEN